MYKVVFSGGMTYYSIDGLIQFSAVNDLFLPA